MDILVIIVLFIPIVLGIAAQFVPQSRGIREDLEHLLNKN